MDSVTRLSWLRRIASDPDSTPAAMRVAIALAYRHNHETGRLDPSIRTLANDVGLTTRAVQKAVSALENSGYLSTKKTTGGHTGNTNSYCLRHEITGMNGDSPLNRRSPLNTGSPANSRSSTPEQPFALPLNGCSPKQGSEQGSEQVITASPDAVGDKATANEVAGKKCGDSYRSKKGRILAGEQFQWFEEFWTAFDFRKGKAEAADIWLTLKITPDVFTKILEGARHEAATRTKPGERGPSPKWAQGWLSGRRWEDDPGTRRGTNGHDFLEEIGL